MARRRPAPPPPVNEALRSHVTSAKFVLTLGATHIACLVRIERDLQRDRTIDEDLAAGIIRSWDPAIGHPLRRAFRHGSAAGLIARGLITHTMPAHRGWRPSQIWTITPAGWAVITLLREAGIWQEYTDALPAIPTTNAA